MEPLYTIHTVIDDRFGGCFTRAMLSEIYQSSHSRISSSAKSIALVSSSANGSFNHKAEFTHRAILRKLGTNHPLASQL